MLGLTNESQIRLGCKNDDVITTALLKIMQWVGSFELIKFLSFFNNLLIKSKLRTFCVHFVHNLSQIDSQLTPTGVQYKDNPDTHTNIGVVLNGI